MPFAIDGRARDRWLELMDRDRESLARHWILTGFSPAYLSTLTPETLDGKDAKP